MKDKFKILIVEDETITSKDMEMSLNSLGYDVVGCAFSGEAAIEFVSKNKVDLMLMDIKLDGKLDGIETTKHILNNFDIPVIYVTSFLDDNTLGKAKLTNPYGYVIKPFNDRELHSTIELALYKHQMEKKLRESEEKYRLIFETAPVSIWECDISEIKEELKKLEKDGISDFRKYFEENKDFVVNALGLVKITNFNEETLYLYGAKNREEMLEEIINIFSKNFYDNLTDLLIAIATGETTFECEAIQSTLRKDRINVIIRARISERKSNYLLITILNTTNLKRVEEALQRSKKLFVLAMEATNDGLWDWNIPMGITYFNPRFYKMLGYDLSELIPSYDSWSNLLHPDDKTNVERELYKHINEKTDGFEMEYRMKTKIGKWKWILNRGRVVEWNSSGEPVRFVGTMVDISERKHIEEKMSVLNKEIIDTQKEVIYTLGDVIETRSKETANHIKRIGELSRILAIKIGLDEKDCEILHLASPMHDIGKIGIPDSILNKPDKLTPEEFEIMKTHTTIGYNILKGSNRKIMKAASIVALQHHERWDGKGYPYGIGGEDIHIFARIITLVDVFDALTHKRTYKEAWTMDSTIDFIESEKGKFFDKKLVDIFLCNLDEFISILNYYPDSEIDELFSLKESFERLNKSYNIKSKQKKQRKNII